MATIRKLKSGRWQAVIRKRATAASQTFRVRAQAESWARSTEDLIERGEYTPSTGVALQSLINRYINEIVPHKKGAESEKYRLGTIGQGLGKVTGPELTPEVVSNWARKRLKLVKSDSVLRDLSVLSAVLDTAATLWGIPITNSAKVATAQLRKRRQIKTPVRRVRRISVEEEVALLGELSDNMGALVRFALETAMRRGELAELDWADIDGAQLVITDDKAGRTTTIPISRAAVHVLDELGHKKSGLVFNLRPDSITQAFNRACVRAKINDLRVHDLRHEATSRLFDQGLSIEEVATITRHSDWRSLKIYTHPSLTRIADKLG